MRNRRMTETVKRAIKAVEMAKLRRSTGVSRMNSVRNKTAKAIMKVESSVMADIEKKKLK